jgi:hypothetical protein
MILEIFRRFYYNQGIIEPKVPGSLVYNNITPNDLLSKTSESRVTEITTLDITADGYVVNSTTVCAANVVLRSDTANVIINPFHRSNKTGPDRINLVGTAKSDLSARKALLKR